MSPGAPLPPRYRIVAIGTIMWGMVESLLRLRGLAWPLLIGLILGGAVMLLGGSALFWALVAAGLAALLIAQFVTFQEPILRPAEQTADDPLAADHPADPGAQSLKGLGLQAMSNALAARGGLGLGAMIERQLSPKTGAESAATAVESLKPLPAFADKLGVARLPGLAATENQR